MKNVLLPGLLLHLWRRIEDEVLTLPLLEERINDNPSHMILENLTNTILERENRFKT
jgi:hypothetical protein